MPYIELKTNVKIDDAKAKGIREMLGRRVNATATYSPKKVASTHGVKTVVANWVTL